MIRSEPVAVASRSFSSHPVLRTELQTRYENITFNETGRTLSGNDLVHFLANHTKAIIGLEMITEEILCQLPELKLISKYGVGLDKIDINALKNHNVLLGWKGGVNRRSVAELALCLIISLIRKIPEALRLTKNGQWQQIKGRLLSQKTVGIIGCGFVGKDLVGLLKPFEVRILIHDVIDLRDFSTRHQAKQVPLNHLLAESDIVTLHVPLNESTRLMIGSDELALMKPTSFLINTSRGGIVDEKALKENLRAQRIAGAAFDVFETEPPNDTELLQAPNFIATPHIGGSSEEAVLAMGRAAIEGLDLV